MALVVAGVVAAIVLGLVVLGLSERTILTHQLLSNDFAAGPGAFETGSHLGYDLRIAHGAYEIEAGPGTDEAVISIGEFARYAYNVEVSAEVTSLDESGPDAVVGLSVVAPAGDAGYSFTVAAVGYGLARGDAEGVEVLAVEEGSPAWPPRHADLLVKVRPDLVGDTVHIQGFVDGELVIETTDHDGVREYGYAGLLFADDAEGSTVTFDDVVAVVPA